MRNSSGSFMPILSKLYKYCIYDAKMSIWFGYIPQIMFYSIFSQVELSFLALLLSKLIESWYLVFANAPTVLCRFL